MLCCIKELWLGSTEEGLIFQSQIARRVTLNCLQKQGRSWLLWGQNDHPRQREASREQDAVHKWGPRSWGLNRGMCERKRSKLREQAPDIRDSAWDPEKIGQFVLIKKATEMSCNDSHTRVADSVGCTLDSDSLFGFKPAQPANLCFLLRWLLCSYLCPNEKKALDAECPFSESIKEKSSEHSETNQS